MIRRRVSMIYAQTILEFIPVKFRVRNRHIIFGLDKIIQEKNSAPQNVKEDKDRRPGDRGAVISHVW